MEDSRMDFIIPRPDAKRSDGSPRLRVTRWFLFLMSVSSCQQFCARLIVMEKRLMWGDASNRKALSNPRTRQWQKDHNDRNAGKRKQRLVERRSDPTEAERMRKASLDAYYRDHEAGKESRRKAREKIKSDPEQRAKWQEYHRDYVRDRRAVDPQYLLMNRLRSRIWNALDLANAKKAYKTEELVGCTLAELRLYLEMQFLPGMTWENRELWHIDHRMPIKSYQLSDPEQQKRAFHFSNLQPLWAQDNLRKSASMPENLLKSDKLLELQ